MGHLRRITRWRDSKPRSRHRHLALVRRRNAWTCPRLVCKRESEPENRLCHARAGLCACGAWEAAGLCHSHRGASALSRHEVKTGRTGRMFAPDAERAGLVQSEATVTARRCFVVMPSKVAASRVRIGWVARDMSESKPERIASLRTPHGRLRAAPATPFSTLEDL